MSKKKSKFKFHIKRLEPVRDKYMFTDNRHPEKGIRVEFYSHKWA